MTPTSRNRRVSKRKAKPRRGTKSGIAYQRAVAEVAQNLRPGAQVKVGTWIEGPDGRRDLDVSVRSADGKVLLAVIECKDWNKPIGIGFIDALDSKRHDLRINTAM